MKNIFCFFSFVFFLLINIGACVARENFTDVKDVSVSIESVYKDSAKVRVTIVNNSNSIFLLSTFNFCTSGVILQDLFQVGRAGGTKYDKAYYGGFVDLGGPDQLAKDAFLSVQPLGELSCEVDLGSFYSVYDSGVFQVIYDFNNPRINGQQGIKLVSNKIDVVLSAGTQAQKSK